MAQLSPHIYTELVGRRNGHLQKAAEGVNG